jgi:hypothetical protein
MIMALLKPTPPPAVTQAFQEGLLTLLDGPSHGRAGQVLAKNYVGGTPAFPSQADVGLLGSTPPEHDPQQVFMLGLTDLASNPGTGAARHDGWRLFAGNTQGKICFGRVKQLAAGGWKLTACFWGDRVWNAFQVSLGLGNLPAVLAADYELRLLGVPGLNLEVFWLVAQPPASGDLVVPLLAAPGQPIPGLFTSAAIPIANFLSNIGPMVQQRMSSPRSHVS